MNAREDYNAWLDSVERDGALVTLRDYRKWVAFDDNLVWRLSSGTIANLLDEATEALDDETKARQEAERLSHQWRNTAERAKTFVGPRIWERMVKDA